MIKTKLGFQLETEKLDVNKVGFPYIPNGHGKSRKYKNVAEWYGYEKCRVTEANAKCLCCHKPWDSKNYRV